MQGMEAEEKRGLLPLMKNHASDCESIAIHTAAIMKDRNFNAYALANRCDESNKDQKRIKR